MLIEAPGYHAHIYFRPDEAAAIAALHARAQEDLGAVASVWPIRHRPVGPHPLPMFEIEFKHPSREAVLAWIQAHHGSHDVLLHPETGNDLIDHTTHAVWLGAPQPLDLSRL